MTLSDATQAEPARDWVLQQVRQGFSWLQPWFVRFQRLAAVNETYALEALESRAPALARGQHFAGAPALLLQRDRQLLALRPEQLAAYMRQYLSDERARSIVMLPSSREPSSGRAHARAESKSAGAVRMAPPQPIADEELQHWMNPLEAQRSNTRTLRNGLTVIVQNRPAASYHTLLLAFSGGEAAGEVPGVSIAEPWSLVGDEWELSAQGLFNRRYHTLDSTVELVRSTGSDIGLSLRALRTHLEGTTVVWPPRRFLDRVESFAHQDALPQNQLGRELAEALFGTDPYGRRPTAAQVHDVRPNSIYRFRSATQRPENGVLVIVGNVDPDVTLGAADDALGSWLARERRSAPVPAPPPSNALPARRLIRDWPGSSRAQLGLSCLLDASEPAHIASLDMLGYVLRNRLFDQLRDQLGASYVVDVRTTRFRSGTGQLELVADVSYDALAASWDSLQAFTQSPAHFEALDLQYGRRAYAAAYNLAYSTTDRLARALAENWMFGFSAADFASSPQRAFSVTPEGVNSMAEFCAAHAVTTLLADRARLPPALAAH